MVALLPLSLLVRFVAGFTIHLIEGCFVAENEFSITLLAFNLWVHHGDSMQVGKRNPLGTVTFTGIDFAANRQTRVIALL